MTTTLDLLLDQYEKGQLDRRQLLKGMTVAISGALTGKAAEAAEPVRTPWAPAMSLNHVHIYVKDIARSMEFYSTVVGAKPKESSPPDAKSKSQTMYLPGAHPGFGSWISISQLTDPNAPPRVDHVGFGITFDRKTGYPRIAEQLKQRYPDLKPARLFTSQAAGEEIYFTDPDGLPVQLIQIEHNGELSGYDTKTGQKIKK